MTKKQKKIRSIVDPVDILAVMGDKLMRISFLVFRNTMSVDFYKAFVHNMNDIACISIT